MTLEQLCHRVIELRATFNTQGVAKRCWDLFDELAAECKKELETPEPLPKLEPISPGLRKNPWDEKPIKGLSDSTND